MPASGQDSENDPAEPDFTVDIPSGAIASAHAPLAVNINTLTNINQVTCVINGVTVDENRQLNPLGNTHDYNSFPNVASIGFAVPAGEQAFYTDVAIHYPGAYGDEEKYDVGDLFGVNTGATPEIVIDGETGFLCGLNDTDRLAELMHKFITHPELIQVMGTKGREHAVKYFSLERNTDEIYALYQEILSRK